MRRSERVRKIFTASVLFLTVMTACSSYTTIYFLEKKPQVKNTVSSASVYSERRIPRTIAFMGGSSARDMMNDRAAEYMMQGKFPQAEILLQSLLSDYPGCAQANNNLGIVYESAGDLMKAFQYLSKACLLEPDNEYYRKNLKSLDTAANEQ
jgi:tetratricopeptide (TPR) repeat protein